MLDRRTAPNFSAEFSFELPTPQIIVLRDDLSLVWLKDIQQEIIKIEFVFEAGKWYEPKKGVSYFTSHMLEKGTANLSAEKIASIFDHHGAQLEVGSGPDFASISLFCLTKNFEVVLPIVIEMLSEATFPKGELELMSSIFLDTLRVNNEKNNFVASKIFYKSIFGASHPYGRYVEENDVNLLDPDDLKSFFKNAFAPVEIFLTGKLNDRQIMLLEKEISRLQKKSKKTLPAFHSNHNATKEKIGKEKSLQTAIRIGKKTIDRNHADYASLLLANHILGGYFGSRLMKNIREEKGLTYGIHSSISSNLNSAVFSIATETNKDLAETTISEIEKEVGILSSIPVDSAELTTSKNHFLGNLQLELSNPFAVADKLKHLRLHKLSPLYYTDLCQAIRSVTCADIARSSAEHIPMAECSVIEVG